MNYTKLPHKVLALLAAPVLISLAVPVTQLAAQSQTETKIKLMAEALRARDAGDLQTAKTNLEELLTLAPNDVTVQRLLAGVNDALAKGATSTAAVELAPAAPAADPVEVSYPPQAGSAAAAAAESPAAAPADSSAAALAAAEEARIADLLKTAKADQKTAAGLAKDGDFDGAAAKLNAAASSLPENTLTAEARADIAAQQTALLLQKSQHQLKQGDTKGAQESLNAYIAATDADKKKADKQAARIDRAELNPGLQPVERVSPEFVADQKTVAALLAKGRSQYAGGDTDGAQETFRYLLTVSAENSEAKYFLKRIADEKAAGGALNLQKTRAQMLEEVTKAWERPQVFVAPTGGDNQVVDDQALRRKLETIIIPQVNFDGLDLARVVSTLSVLTEENDKSASGMKGVNISMGENSGSLPTVNFSARGLSAKRILDLVTDQVGYSYEVQSDIVLVRRGGGAVGLTTDEFPISKSALTRITGIGGASSASSASASADPFAPAPAASAPAGGATSGGEADAIKNFLQASGVDFTGVQGSSLAYDGARIIVTQVPRNIERIRNIVARYNDVRQVEIEAKFLDVQEGSLEELGVQWGALYNQGGRQIRLGTANNGAQLRSLSSAFLSSSGGGNGSIVRPEVVIPPVVVGGSVITPGRTTVGINQPIVNQPPTIPGTVDIGGGLANVAAVTGARIGDFDVSATLRALSLKQGTDLLSAPKVTVLSGNRATITVAQELRYPQSYGEVQSQVGTASGSSTSGGSAGVTITSGTPQDFTVRNIGVELGVTPTVEEDEYSISLELNPRVTEFEGFVEYGGQSVAISGDTTVTVPSGFYQPIFSSREINTKVTVWDGATLVMGGLTREEVKRVNDKIPVLGDIPFVGRAFRSKGESSSKRNLLIFVTANLVSPGGSLKKQELKGVAPSSIYQSPTVVTPGSAESRIRGAGQ